MDADAEAVVTVLLSLADGLALRMLADPEHDWGPTLAAAMPAARALLTPPLGPCQLPVRASDGQRGRPVVAALRPLGAGAAA